MTEPPPEAWWVRDRPPSPSVSPSLTTASLATVPLPTGPLVAGPLVTGPLVTDPESAVVTGGAVTTAVAAPPVIVRHGAADRPEVIDSPKKRSGPAKKRSGPAAGTDQLRPAPPKARPRPSRGTLVAMAAVLTVALTGAGVMLAWDPADHPVAEPPAVSILPVDPATVSAAASSTQGADGAISYTATNTLDGDPATAWNSNGAPLSEGRTWLRYTFAGPVDLRSVSILNGYQKVRPRAGKTSLDLYPANRRARRVRVVTDTGSFVWDLADTRSRQTFTDAAGHTTSVRLEMLTSYPSTAYPDLAISEVSFTAAVPATPS